MAILCNVVQSNHTLVGGVNINSLCQQDGLFALSVNRHSKYLLLHDTLGLIYKVCVCTDLILKWAYIWVFPIWKRRVRAFSVRAFILWITRTHIRVMIIRSNLGWFLLAQHFIMSPLFRMLLFKYWRSIQWISFRCIFVMSSRQTFHSKRSH